MISEKEYRSDSEDSGVWAARRQRSSRCKPIPSRRRLRRVGRSEDLYLYSRDEHQWTILQSVVGRVKTGNDGELLNCKYGLLVVSMMYHLSLCIF